MRQYEIEQATERQLITLAKSFDYGLADEDERDEAIETTVATLRVHKQLHDSAWQLGQLLSEQKARLEHGAFGRWLEEILKWEPRYAQLYMRIFTRWPDKEIYLSSGVGLLDFSKQALLAAESAPATAAARVVEIVATRNGAQPSTREVRSVIRQEQYKEAAPLDLALTCDVLRRYARNQGAGERVARIESVSMDALQTLAPRGTKLIDDVVEQAKEQVLSEMESLPVAPPVVTARYVPAIAEDGDDDRLITQRVTLKASQWNRLSGLGNGDWVRGLARLLERADEDFD